jgi:hypothetical protein
LLNRHRLRAPPPMFGTAQNGARVATNLGGCCMNF